MESIPSCPSKKKFFISETEAVEFEKQNRERYDFSPQRAYKCEKCVGWHLTTLSTDAYAMSKSKIYESSPNVATTQRVTGVEKLDRDALIMKLFNSGKERQRIAEEVGCSYQTVCITLRESNGPKETVKVEQFSTPEEFAEAKKTLLAQLQKLEQGEQQLIQRKALKLLPCQNGEAILIEKEGNRLALALPDCRELVEKMSALLGEMSSERLLPVQS